jgi:hypothetical protein
VPIHFLSEPKMAINAWYSPGIRIYGKKGPSFVTGADMSSAEASAYIATAKKWLEQLKKLPTGAALLQEIDASGRICYIMEGPNPMANKAMLFSTDPAPSTLVATDPTKQRVLQDLLRKQLGGMAAPITPPKKILIQDKEVQSAAYASLKGQLAAIGAPQHKTDTSGNLVTLTTNMRAGGISNPIVSLSTCTGRSTLEVQDWLMGVDSPDRDSYFRIVAAYYEYFPRGAGVDTVVLLAAGADAHTPDYIQLGHELIHAWRMMTGRRIVGGNSWEEEAMTVGLAPFAGLRFTENALRRDARLPARLKYGGMVAASSESMTRWKNDVEDAPTVLDTKYRGATA